MAWIIDGQPEDDPRQQAYLAMQRAIDAIKADYRGLKGRLEKIRAKLEKKRIVYHVVPDKEQGQWQVKRVGTSRATSTHEKKNDAVAAVRELGQKKQPSQIVINKADGTIQSERTYGDDPRRTPG